jgi:hypothetical protein
MMPPVWTTTSILPKLSSAVLKTESTSASESTSALTAMARPPSGFYGADHRLCAGRISGIVRGHGKSVLCEPLGYGSADAA